MKSIKYFSTMVATPSGWSNEKLCEDKSYTHHLDMSSGDISYKCRPEEVSDENR